MLQNKASGMFLKVQTLNNFNEANLHKQELVSS